MTPRRVLLPLAAVALALAACASETSAGTSSTTASTPSGSGSSSVTSTCGAQPRPEWLGTRVLPLREDGFGQVLPTPPELVDRRLDTPDHLPPPEHEQFSATSDPVPAEVLARSTWSDACPVRADQLRYVTVPFHGFDGEAHTGELLVHADAVDAVVSGFRVLFERSFPIEEMRVVRADELDLPPTGDGNNTTAFVCRPSRGSSSWSQHAYGRAVDVNPFHNPYVKGDLVLPELASAYVDRSTPRPGMLQRADVAGFLEHGWHWGSDWRSLKDHMHLSATGG